MQEYDIRKRLLIIIGVSVFLLAILFLALYFLRPKSEEETAEVGDVVTTPAPLDQATTGAGIAPPDVTRVATRTVTDHPPIEDPGELYAVQLASIFAERFLSYSNQNENSHIDIATSLATERAALWIRTQGQQQSDVYEGVSTRVVTTALSAYDDARATVLIDMKRTYSGAREDSEFSRARVELVKIGSDWKVDGFYLNPESEGEQDT